GVPPRAHRQELHVPAAWAGDDLLQCQVRPGHRPVWQPHTVQRRPEREQPGVTVVPMRTEKDKMLADELYDPLDAELVQARERTRDLCQALNATRVELGAVYTGSLSSTRNLAFN